MLEVDLEPTVDARLLEVTSVGWADPETFVVAIKNPTGFAAVEVRFELEDGSGSAALDMLGPGQTRKAIVVDSDGKLVRKIAVPSAAAPNLTFSEEGKTLFVMAVDDTANPPYKCKVYSLALD